MHRNRWLRFGFVFVVGTYFAFSGLSTCNAEKGGNGNGNGGGKPGGDPPPPTAPVTYSVNVIGLPGLSSAFYSHNDLGAMVGSLYDAPPGGRRALAYLPGVTSGAVYLDDPNFGLQNIPSGWHTRSAVDINSHGTIVGNMELDDAPDTDVRPMYITGATTGSPVLHEFATPFNANAWHEVVTSVNDSGDMVVWSQEKLPDGSAIDRVYVGNPFEGQSPADFVEIDFAGQGYANTQFSNTELAITERQADGSFFVAGSIRYEGQSASSTEPFRANSNDFAVEVGSTYTEADGSEVEWYGASTEMDVRDNGDIVGNAIIRPAKNGKIKNNFFSALWAIDSDEFVSTIGEDRFQTDYSWSATNNDGDYLMGSPYAGWFDTFWHSEWSTDNGPVLIADLIDTDDPYRNAYDFDAPWEMTEHTDSVTGWPTILGQEYVTLEDGSTQTLWLVLTPSMVSSQLANSTAVPEPSIEELLAFSVVICLLSRRQIEQHHRLGD